MPTTVRVEDDVKRELDRLQGDILADRGERLSHSEILSRLVRFARLHDEALLASEGDAQRPTLQAIDRFLARLPKAQAGARARDVDSVLYGSRP